MYVDRVAGLVTGLWRSGPLAQLLLVVVVAALMSPVVYIGFGWLAKRWRRLRTGLLDRQAERDVPRRVDALRASVLRDLPTPALTALAASARWVHPRTGQQLVFAGGPQPEVFAVVDGALEGRAPADPGGTVRERVGAGGLVGLGAALSGTAVAAELVHRRHHAAGHAGERGQRGRRPDRRRHRRVVRHRGRGRGGAGRVARPGRSVL